MKLLFQNSKSSADSGARTKSSSAIAVPFLIAVLAGIFSSSASAGIIDNGSYTTIDGIDWLDLSASVGTRLTDIGATFGADGWELATKAQTDAMFSQFFSLSATSPGVTGVSSPVSWIHGVSGIGTTTGVSFTGAGSNSSDYDDNLFQQLFGATDTFSTSLGASTSSYGFYANGTEISVGGMELTDFFFPVPSSDEIKVQFTSELDLTGLADSSHDLGFFLTRSSPSSSVPEPSTLVLLGLSLFGLGIRRRKVAL